MRIALPTLFVNSVVTAQEMRALDLQATEKYGIPSRILMENAGHVVSDAALEMMGPYRQSVLILCGPGNNGGDGFVAARHLHNAGADVVVHCFGSRQAIKGDALANLEIAEKMGLTIRDGDTERMARYVSRANLVIDALLGTGIKGDVRSPYADVISAVNASEVFVLSVDVPSGIDVDTGRVCGCAIKADVTVTLALPKIGLLTGEGVAYVGDVKVGDIGLPYDDFKDSKPATSFLDRYSLGRLMLRRIADSHKGTFGHTAIVAGSVGMTGAATLAAEGALRIGTGLVTVLVPESLNDIMEAKLTEAMTIPVPQGNARAFGMASLESVLDYVRKWDSAVIGPGFGRDEDTIAFALALIRKLKKPAIIDADALYAVSTDLSVLRKCKSSLVITPHPGEMATLLGTTTEQVQSNRLEVARSFAKEHGITVVLKGAGTVIAEPEGKAYINTTGTPGMATGGTGDVLSGMIGGLLAQKQSAGSAATAAVYLHGLAGEVAARKRGEAAMLASDLADSIGDAIAEVTNAEF